MLLNCYILDENLKMIALIPDSGTEQTCTNFYLAVVKSAEWHQFPYKMMEIDFSFNYQKFQYWVRKFVEYELFRFVLKNKLVDMK